VIPVSATGKHDLPADDIGSLPMKKREGLACQVASKLRSNLIFNNSLATQRINLPAYPTRLALKCSSPLFNPVAEHHRNTAVQPDWYSINILAINGLQFPFRKMKLLPEEPGQLLYQSRASHLWNTTAAKIKMPTRQRDHWSPGPAGEHFNWEENRRSDALRHLNSVGV